MLLIGTYGIFNWHEFLCAGTYGITQFLGNRLFARELLSASGYICTSVAFSFIRSKHLNASNISSCFGILHFSEIVTLGFGILAGSSVPGEPLIFEQSWRTGSAVTHLTFHYNLSFLKTEFHEFSFECRGFVISFFDFWWKPS